MGSPKDCQKDCSVLDKKDIEIRNLKAELHNKRKIVLQNINLSKRIEQLELKQLENKITSLEQM